MRPSSNYKDKWNFTHFFYPFQTIPQETPTLALSLDRQTSLSSHNTNQILRTDTIKSRSRIFSNPKNHNTNACTVIFLLITIIPTILKCVAYKTSAAQLVIQSSKCHSKITPPLSSTWVFWRMPDFPTLNARFLSVPKITIHENIMKVESGEHTTWPFESNNRISKNEDTFRQFSESHE